MFYLIKFGFYPKNPKFYSKYPFEILKHKKATEEQKAESIKSCLQFSSKKNNQRYC
jgi:hypothetical protein